MKKKYHSTVGSCCFLLIGALLFCACTDDEGEDLYSANAMSMFAAGACESLWNQKDCFGQTWCEEVINICVDHANENAYEGTEQEVRDFCYESCGVMAFECQIHDESIKSTCTILNGDCRESCAARFIYEPDFD